MTRQRIQVLAYHWWYHTTAPFAVAAARVLNTRPTTQRCLWCISARLSPSIWPQIAWCKRQVCPCYTTLPATSNCPVYTSAQRQMYWGEPLSSPASSTATPTRLFPTNLRLADSWDQHPLMPSRIAGTAADCTRWISGCGATDGASPGRCPSRRQRLPGRIESARQGEGQKRPKNAAGRRQPESVQRQPNENICCHTTYDVTYDITIWHQHMISLLVLMISLKPCDIRVIHWNMISCFVLWYHNIYDFIGDIWYHGVYYDIIHKTMIS